MELFIKVYFWLAIISVVLRFICIGYVDYPRETSRGTDTISLMMALPFVAWAAYLIWA